MNDKPKIFFYLSNLLGWHCLLKSIIRFQEYDSIMPVYCCIVGSPSKVKPPSITLYLIPFTLYYVPRTLCPLWKPAYCCCFCVFLFVSSFIAFRFISHIWVKSYVSSHTHNCGLQRPVSKIHVCVHVHCSKRVFSEH